MQISKHYGIHTFSVNSVVIKNDNSNAVVLLPFTEVSTKTHTHKHKQHSHKLMPETITVNVFHSSTRKTTIMCTVLIFHITDSAWRFMSLKKAYLSCRCLDDCTFSLSLWVQINIGSVFLLVIGIHIQELPITPVTVSINSECQPK